MRRSKTFLIVILALVAAFGTQAAAAGEKPAFKVFHRIVEASFVKEVVDGRSVGLVIDARPKRKKFDKGHIPGALSMPASRFDEMKGLLPADKGALIVFYCGGLKCALSHKNAHKAEALGYTNVHVFAKGYPEWKKQHVSGPALAAAGAKTLKTNRSLRFKAGKEEGSIDFEEFQKVVRDLPDAVYLVDNRDPHEFQAGTLPHAINIPTDELEKRLSSWKVDKPIIYFCGTGARSGEAYYMTRDKRPELIDVYYVDGEMSFRKDGSFTLSPSK